MSRQNQKAVIVKSDDGVHKSFYAYTRPARLSGHGFTAGSSKVVDLDPPNDGDVCEAYRQIRIKDQNKRIVKNREKLAKERHAATLETQQAERIAAEHLAIRAERKNKHSSSQKKNAFTAKMLAAFNAGMYIEAPHGQANRTRYMRDITELKAKGLDVVTVSTQKTANNPNSVFFWSVDNFKRTTKKIKPTLFNNGPMTAALKTSLKEALLTGCLITEDNIDASANLIVRTLSELRRKEGLAICLVRHGSTKDKIRGWILPCAANGLSGAKKADI